MWMQKCAALGIIGSPKHFLQNVLVRSAGAIAAGPTRACSLLDILYSRVMQVMMAYGKLLAHLTKSQLHACRLQYLH